MNSGVEVAQILWERLETQSKRIGELSETLIILKEQQIYIKESIARISLELSDIKKQIDEVKEIAEDNQEFVQQEKSARQKRTERLLNNSYGMVFSWVQAVVGAIAVASLTWLFTHRSPRVDNPPPATIEQAK